MSLTPMLTQYQSIRRKLSPDTILFFRLGDFYEMFFDDARRASALLDITLTARDGGNSTRVPMCGVPYHAAQGYINRLTRSGLKVAVCEQIGDPAQSKGPVKREVVRIVSPGTNLEDDSNVLGQHSFIMALCRTKPHWGCAWVDAGTGDFSIAECSGLAEIEEEVVRLQPRECIVPARDCDDSLQRLLQGSNATVTEYDDWVFEHDSAARLITEHFQVASLASFGITESPAGVGCAGALLYYLREILPSPPGHLKPPVYVERSDRMRIDRHTIRNLEIIAPAGGDPRGPSLYSTLNCTVTPMGARLLGQWLTAPLTAAPGIRERLDAVAAFVNSVPALELLRAHLAQVRDIERLLARINCGAPSARDLVALGASLRAIPDLREAVAPLQPCLLAAQREQLAEDLLPLADSIAAAFVDSPPPTVREGGFIRSGYSPELDQLRNVSGTAKEWIIALQQREIEKTGIKSLKIKYNRVFGYYIEVTKPNLPMVPATYIRKQTMANAERFIIPELKEYEEKILGAEERACELEYRLFEEARQQVLACAALIQQTARAIAVLDVLGAFAQVAREWHYCKPEIDEGSRIYLAGSRHPVVERTLQEQTFIENDVLLDTDENQLLIITGPNMAGKSTFIRQIALITLMAHTGSFVPARVASVGVVDRIFSRIGASDNLARGESTFMVEMIETANILHNASNRSLLVFDEIGRGTSTFDGISIAWSICEHLNRDTFRPKCLFATHYHELTELADHRHGIQNYTVTVKELEDNILFLRRVLPGSADRSYGIHVAKLAGLPRQVVSRAGEILLCLEEEKISEASIASVLKKKHASDGVYDLPLFRQLRSGRDAQPLPETEAPPPPPHPVLEELQSIDVNIMTPLEALSKLLYWQQTLHSEDPPESRAPEPGSNQK